MEPPKMTEQLQSIFQRYEGRRDDLIPILQDIQNILGYIPRDAMSHTAGFLNLTGAAVYGVVTFYAQFYLTRQGKHRIKVCTGTACHVRGGSSVMRTVRKRLGIGPGQTTPDYEFSLERVACLGSCALAPVMMVNNKVYGTMTTTKVERLIEELQNSSGTGAGADAADRQANNVPELE